MWRCEEGKKSIVRGGDVASIRQSKGCGNAEDVFLGLRQSRSDEAPSAAEGKY